MDAETPGVDESQSTDHDPTPSPGPVVLAERIRSLDVLRGIAVLGILLVNVWAYALVFPASVGPGYVGCNSPVDQAVVLLTWLVAYTKFMPIFSMLFGAGIILFTERIEARGLKPRNLFFRRQFWLLMFGLVHAYLLWAGDILVPYALYGMIVYLFRRKGARTLIVLGILANLVPAGLMLGGAGYMAQVQFKGEAAESTLQAGEELTVEQREYLDAWREMRVTWNPTAEDLDAREAIMRSGYGEILTTTVPDVAMMHLFLYPMFAGWQIAGMMLIGMALYKTGVLRGERTTGFYARMLVICYSVGLPMVVVGFLISTSHPGDMLVQMRSSFPMNVISGPVVALGHIALIMLAVNKAWLGWLERRFAAAGRMAFTNYISQTVICITIFYGFGFGLFGTMNRIQLLALAVAIWILQLWWSPLWLGRYRFGPLEWLWRSLTYGRRQPLRLGSRILNLDPRPPANGL
jgi:uncharacterized protein